VPTHNSLQHYKYTKAYKSLQKPVLWTFNEVWRLFSPRTTVYVTLNLKHRNKFSQHGAPKKQNTSFDDSVTSIDGFCNLFIRVTPLKLDNLSTKSQKFNLCMHHQTKQNNAGCIAWKLLQLSILSYLINLTYPSHCAIRAKFNNEQTSF